MAILIAAERTVGVWASGDPGSYAEGLAGRATTSTRSPSERRDFLLAPSLTVRRRRDPFPATSLYGTSVAHRPSPADRRARVRGGGASGCDPGRRDPAGAYELPADDGLDGRHRRPARARHRHRRRRPPR